MHKGDALEWLTSNKYRFNACEEVMDAIREYYGNQFAQDRALNKICYLNQTGTVQKCLNNIDRCNIYTKMTDHYRINIILKGIGLDVSQAMACEEDFYSDPFKLKKQFLHIDFITTVFQKQEQDNKCKGQRKKCGLVQQVQLRGG